MYLTLQVLLIAYCVQGLHLTKDLAPRGDWMIFAGQRVGWLSRLRAD